MDISENYTRTAAHRIDVDGVVSRTIDPADHMYNTDPEWYFRSGAAGLKVVHQVLGLSKTRKIRTILDLPSGHGRVARYLRAGFPDAAITFCDLDERGAAFCAKEFNGTIQKCSPEMSQIEFSGTFDIIWVGSLFTHVDFERTKRWLKHLCSALSHDGVLVATFHGCWSIEVNKRFPFIDQAAWNAIVLGYETTGYGYAPYSPNQDIGVSLTKASKIVEVVENIPRVRLLCYYERGWGDNHDVLGVAKRDRLAHT